MFVREMLAHYFSNLSEIRDWKFITRYWDVLMLHCEMLSPKEYSHFCGVFFQSRGSPWAMKRWKCYCIFDQMLTKGTIWSIPMVPFAKENAAYRDTLTHKSENLLKKRADINKRVSLVRCNPKVTYKEHCSLEEELYCSWEEFLLTVNWAVR